MTTDLYNKIVGERGSLENLLSKMPGFRGYMDMSARREADRQIRDHVAAQYESQLVRFGNVESVMVREGGLLFMDRTKSIRTKLENLRRRIASDTPGYSGFFAANKIGADDLQRVYAFDESMLRYADEIALKIDGLQTAASANDGLSEALTQLDNSIQEAHQAYDLRDTVLTGIA